MASRFLWLNRTIFGFGLASLFSDMSQEVVTLILPTFIISFVGLDKAPLVIGLIAGSSEVIASFTRLIAGFISDRLQRRKPLVAAGYAIAGFMLGWIGYVSSVAQVWALYAISWAGKGMRESPRDALLADSVDEVLYGKAFGFQRAMDTLGSVIGPLIFCAIMSSISLNAVFFLSWVPSAASVLVIMAFIQEKKYYGRSMSRVSAIDQLIGLPRSFLFFLLPATVFGCAYFSKAVFLLRAQELVSGAAPLSQNLSHTTLLFVLFNLIRALSEYSAGMVSDLLGRRFTLSVFGYLLFGFLALGLSFSHVSFTMLVLIFIGMGISAGTVKVVTRAYSAELLPDSKGTGFGLIQLIEGSGDFVASTLVGLLWTSTSAYVAFTTAADIAIVAGTMLLMMPTRSK